MKRLQIHRLGLALVLALLLFVPLVLAQDDYALPWWTADCGGGSVTGDGYTLMGTIGQPDAGALAGNGYTLAGGFWSGAGEEPTPTLTPVTPTPTPGAPPDEPSPVFLPLVLKNC